MRVMLLQVTPAERAAALPSLPARGTAPNFPLLEPGGVGDACSYMAKAA